MNLSYFSLLVKLSKACLLLGYWQDEVWFIETILAKLSRNNLQNLCHSKCQQNIYGLKGEIKISKLLLWMMLKNSVHKKRDKSGLAKLRRNHRKGVWRWNCIELWKCHEKIIDKVVQGFERIAHNLK